MGLLQSTPAEPVSLTPGPDVDVKPAWAAKLPASSPVVYFDVAADGQPIGNSGTHSIYSKLRIMQQLITFVVA